ncbi:STAS domain-containing protein [Actinoplanes sp. DH11]|uniref:STAS domain-containing protein n=1 Tax=Actinoplanes sp. DH11 TaxID=2857011 RepID=UPI001E4332F3|nr:STAS domain-containing protein [Actinoplanes sp. DH11]
MEHPPIWRHQLTKDAGVCTIALAGELDLACSATLQGLLIEQAQAAGVADLRVDLAEVGFLDSTVLGVLISAMHYATEQGRGFSVVAPSPAGQRILAITGLDTVLAGTDER